MNFSINVLAGKPENLFVSLSWESMLCQQCRTSGHMHIFLCVAYKGRDPVGLLCSLSCLPAQITLSNSIYAVRGAV